MSWVQHYLSFDTPMEEKQDFQSQVFPVAKVKKKRKGLRLADLRKMALRFAREEKRLRQAQDIRKIEPKKENPKHISSLIFQILSASSPKHITSIITELETLGWKSNSIYHKYNNVQHALTNNYHMFERTGIGTYQIRKAFRADKQEPIKKQTRKDYPAKIATIKDIAENVVKDYADHNDLTANDIYYIMYNMGVNCSYSAVYKALQDERFKKDNKWYILK